MRPDGKKLFISFLFLSIWSLSMPPANAQSPEWMNYSGSYWINSIAEEGDYLWVGTRAGLYKMHKHTGEKELFTSADGLPGLSVFVAIDARGNKWFAGSDGLVRFDGTDRTYYPMRFVVWPFVDTSNRVWVGAEDGLYRFDGEAREHYTEANSELPTNKVANITEDKEGNIWVATRTGKLVRINTDDVWTVYDIPFGEFAWAIIYDIAVDDNGTVWLTTTYGAWDGQEYALARFDGEYWKFYHMNDPPFHSSYVWGVAVDKLNHLWVGFNDGLAEFDENSWRICNDTNSGLSGGAVRYLYIDQENTKWVHNDYRGLVRYDGQTWTVYPLVTAPHRLGYTLNGCQTLMLDGEDNAWMIDRIEDQVTRTDSCYGFWTIRKLSGHKDIQTTMIFTHVLQKGVSGVRSPADRLDER